MINSTIIFEGLNCTGKSSLIRYLRENVDNENYVHQSRTKFLNANKMDTTYGYMKAMLDILKFTGMPIWFDRFHFTECVYGTIVRNYNKYEQSKMFAEIDYCLNELENVKVVYLSDDVQNIVKRTNELRGWGDIETISKLNDAMNNAMDSSCLPILKVNYWELFDNANKMQELMTFIKGE